MQMGRSIARCELFKRFLNLYKLYYCLFLFLFYRIIFIILLECTRKSKYPERPKRGINML